MKLNLVNFAGILLFSTVAIAADTQPSELVGLLSERGYFKKATCAEVSSSFLDKLGLPPIGQNKMPGQGTRGTFDRSKETAPQPTIRDSITVDGQKTLVETKTQPTGAGKRFVIQLDRASAAGAKAAGLKSDLVFTVGADSTCAFEKAVFRSPRITINGKTPKSGVALGSGGCLAMFTGAGNASATPQSVPGWVRSDCAMALHYATETPTSVQ